MIKFNLVCDQDHDFEIWFGSSEDFEKQKQRKLLSCPHCDSKKVEKSLMAPSVTTGRKKDNMVELANKSAMQKELVAKIKELREHVVANGEDVGAKFADEARKIHYGDAEKRGIYGKASVEEAVDLIDEGVEIAPLPELPEEKN